MADGSFDADLPETLMTQPAFRAYFKGGLINGQVRWYRVVFRAP